MNEITQVILSVGSAFLALVLALFSVKELYRSIRAKRHLRRVIFDQVPEEEVEVWRLHLQTLMESREREEIEVRAKDVEDIISHIRAVSRTMSAEERTRVLRPLYQSSAEGKIYYLDALLSGAAEKATKACHREPV